MEVKLRAPFKPLQISYYRDVRGLLGGALSEHQVYFLYLYRLFIYQLFASVEDLLFINYCRSQIALVFML